MINQNQLLFAFLCLYHLLIVCSNFIWLSLYQILFCPFVWFLRNCSASSVTSLQNLILHTSLIHQFIQQLIIHKKRNFSTAHQPYEFTMSFITHKISQKMFSLKMWAVASPSLKFISSNVRVVQASITGSLIIIEPLGIFCHYPVKPVVPIYIQMESARSSSRTSR